MKWLLIPMLCFISVRAEAQTLQPGEYSTRQPIGSITFILKDSGQQFFWVADDCNMGITGMGTWKQISNRLIFNFSAIAPPAFLKRPPVIEKNPDNNDSFRVHLKITDAGDTTFKRTGIYILQKGTKQGVVTDSTGQASIQLNGSQATLLISGPGYEPDSVYIPARGNWYVTVYMKPLVPVFIREVTNEYVIVKKTKDFIQLQHSIKANERPPQKFYFRKQVNQQTEAYIRHWLLKER